MYVRIWGQSEFLTHTLEYKDATLHLLKAHAKYTVYKINIRIYIYICDSVCAYVCMHVYECQYEVVSNFDVID